MFNLCEASSSTERYRKAERSGRCTAALRKTKYMFTAHLSSRCIAGRFASYWAVFTSQGRRKIYPCCALAAVFIMSMPNNVYLKVVSSLSSGFKASNRCSCDADLEGHKVNPSKWRSFFSKTDSNDIYSVSDTLDCGHLVMHLVIATGT